MKYLLTHEGVITTAMSSIFQHELRRFDIRAEIVAVENDRSIRKKIREFSPDLLISFGTSKSVQNLQNAKKRGIRSCFFYQSLLDHKTPSLPKHADRLTTDIPVGISEIATAYFTYDLLKSMEESNDQNDDKRTIGILYADKSRQSRANRLAGKLSRSLDGDIIPINLSQSQSDWNKVKHANAALVLDKYSNVFAAYNNVPVINVFESFLFKSSGDKESIINQLLEKQVVQNIPSKSTEKMLTELNRILSDYNYCAQQLDQIQNLKERIGMRPFAREAAREIVEWLESD